MWAAARHPNANATGLLRPAPPAIPPGDSRSICTPGTSGQQGRGRCTGLWALEQASPLALQLALPLPQGLARAQALSSRSRWLTSYQEVGRLASWTPAPESSAGAPHTVRRAGGCSRQLQLQSIQDPADSHPHGPVRHPIWANAPLRSGLGVIKPCGRGYSPVAPVAHLSRAMGRAQDRAARQPDARVSWGQAW